MQSIPDRRTKKTKSIADHRGDHDKGNGSHRIEWFHKVNRLDHVCPENEIDDRLRPAGYNKKGPNEMPPADQCADHQSNFIGVRHGCSLLIYSYFPAPAWRNF